MLSKITSIKETFYKNVPEIMQKKSLKLQINVGVEGNECKVFKRQNYVKLKSTDSHSPFFSCWMFELDEVVWQLSLDVSCQGIKK